MKLNLDILGKLSENPIKKVEGVDPCAFTLSVDAVRIRKDGNQFVVEYLLNGEALVCTPIQEPLDINAGVTIAVPGAAIPMRLTK